MSITRADVADLREGDVVEYVGHTGLRGATLIGPLVAHPQDGTLSVGGYVVRFSDGTPPGQAWGALTLTVISRAPRPLYTNSGKTEPDPGDVVRDADSDDNRIWCYDGFIASRGEDDVWWPSCAVDMTQTRDDLPARLRLLVDGRSGQTVPTVMERG